MTGSEIVLLAAAGVLVILAALYEAVVSALDRFSGSRLEVLREQEPRQARVVARLWDARARITGSLLLGQVMSLVAATLFTTVVLLPDGLSGHRLRALLVWFVLASVVYIVVRVAARTIGRQYPETTLRYLAAPARLTAGLLGPVARSLIIVGTLLTPGPRRKDGPFTSQAELRELVDQAGAAELIEDEERQMIHSVFQLGHTIAREVMVPRTEMVYIERDKTLRQALNLGLRSGYSRIPVIGDSPDDVVGIAYLKDVTRRVFERREAEREPVSTVMRPATFVPDSKDADDLLRAMQADRIHMAIVVDEFGGTDGLVTIEDILEEIVGEIDDEYDTRTPEVVALPEGGWRVSARMSVEHLADLTGMHLNGDVEGVETVAGLLALRLGVVPIPGARITEQGHLLVAESAEGRRKRIGTIVIRPVPPPADPDEEGEDGDADGD